MVVIMIHTLYTQYRLNETDLTIIERLKFPINRNFGYGGNFGLGDPNIYHYVLYIPTCN